MSTPELESPRSAAEGDVSFLIGSGFSVPAGYPTTSQINQRLAKINESEICVHSSGDAWFLNGMQDPNAEWMGTEERHFVQEFLEFYQSTILGGSHPFHYETFYDYYRQALEGNRCPDELIPFFRGFRARHPAVIGDDEHLLRRFHQTFSQLIAGLLTKKPERSHLAKAYDRKYGNFLLLTERLAQSNYVHFHSLNHDLWLERLAFSDSIQCKMDDGFEEVGSPFYGELDRDGEHYMVRLSRFTNKFDARFRLYKLHGSVDRYWFQADGVPELIRLKWGMSHIHLYKELQADGVLQYVDDPFNFYPDFLTGTTHKIGKYGRGPYYPVILHHLETNLTRSKALIVIGYGFGDNRINEHIEKYFLSNEGKPVFIVDVKRPDWAHMDSARVHFDAKGVSGMDIDTITSNLA